MDVSRVIQSLSFIGDLKAAATHTEAHGIHVNLPRVGFIFSNLGHIGLSVFIDRYKYFYFLTSTFSDRFHKTLESRMRILCAIYDEFTSRVIIDRSQVIWVSLDFIWEQRIKNHNVILSAKDGRAWKGSEAELVAGTKLFKNAPPINDVISLYYTFFQV